MMPVHEILLLIAPLSDIPMFYIEYLTIHKVQMHAGAIRQLLYGCACVREIIYLYIRTNHTITYIYCVFESLLLVYTKYGLDLDEASCK